MQIVLTGVEERLVEAWRRFCGDLPDVTVHLGSILDVECDAVVSPANSYGFMDGGIDGVYLDHFGPVVQQRVQAVINTFHHRELLVGQADVVPTDHADIPWLICAPTMRVPMILTDTVNPYLAARAALLLVASGRFGHGPRRGEPVRDHVRTVAFPGLGTGAGRVPYKVCARQVRAAIDEVLVAPAAEPDASAGPVCRGRRPHRRRPGGRPGAGDGRHLPAAGALRGVDALSGDPGSAGR